MVNGISNINLPSFGSAFSGLFGGVGQQGGTTPSMQGYRSIGGGAPPAVRGIGPSEDPMQSNQSLFGNIPTRGQMRANMISDAVDRFGGDGRQDAGAAIGSALGQAIGSLFGGQLPGVERANKIRSVESQIKKEGISMVEDPSKFYTRTAELLADNGMQNDALRVMQMGQQFQQQEREGTLTDLKIANEVRDLSAVPERDNTTRVIRGGTELGDLGNLSPGQTGIATINPQGEIVGLKNVQDEEPPEGIEVDNYNRYRDKTTGDTVTLVETGQGLARQGLDENDQPRFTFVNADDYEEISAAETAQVSQYGQDFSTIGTLRNSTLNFINQGSRVVNEITPETTGLTGGIIRGLDRMKEQAIGAFRAVSPGATEVGTYTDKFEELGFAGLAAEQKAALVDLAIAKTYVDQGGQGDLRKNEVERSMEALQIGSGSPQQLKAAIERTMENAISNYNIQLDTVRQESGDTEVPYESLTLGQALKLTNRISGGGAKETGGGNGGGGGTTTGAVTLNQVQNMSLQDLGSLYSNPDRIPNDPQVVTAISRRIEQLQAGGQ